LEIEVVLEDEEEDRKANGDWGFLSYLKKKKNQKGKAVLTLVNTGRCGRGRAVVRSRVR
jgi:hypothetical protein